MFVPSPIERTREGDYRLRLSDAERELLRTLPNELLRLLSHCVADQHEDGQDIESPHPLLQISVARAKGHRIVHEQTSAVPDP